MPARRRGTRSAQALTSSLTKPHRPSMQEQRANTAACSAWPVDGASLTCQEKAHTQPPQSVWGQENAFHVTQLVSTTLSDNQQGCPLLLVPHSRTWSPAHVGRRAIKAPDRVCEEEGGNCSNVTTS